MAIAHPAHTRPTGRGEVQLDLFSVFDDTVQPETVHRHHWRPAEALALLRRLPGRQTDSSGSALLPGGGRRVGAGVRVVQLPLQVAAEAAHQQNGPVVLYRLLLSHEGGLFQSGGDGAAGECARPIYGAILMYFVWVFSLSCRPAGRRTRASIRCSYSVMVTPATHN